MGLLLLMQRCLKCREVSVIDFKEKNVVSDVWTQRSLEDPSTDHDIRITTTTTTATTHLLLLLLHPRAESVAHVL